ncbi:MAG: AAA family ATPase [Oceanococcus sp.]
MSSSISQFLATANRVILGKPDVLKLSLSCLLAQGHLLIEDIPGVGKTTLAKTLAHLLGLDYRRVQFTSDLLPADIAGVSIFDKETSQFRFQPGPIFSQVLLADEINRASPKTQSALLEAMEEGQVTSDGETRPLPQPFFVIATQNPLDQIGTFALPESQLDRFLMRLSIGYPSQEAERELLLGQSRHSMLQQVENLLDDKSVRALQRQAQSVTCSPALINYILELVAATRSHARVRLGLSPRSGLAIKAAAQSWAMLHERSAVLPEDVQAIFPHVAGHRLQLQHGDDQGVAVLIRDLLADVAIP